MLVYPGGDRVVLVDLIGNVVRLAAPGAHVPGDLVRSLVILRHPIKRKDFPEFMGQSAKQFLWIFLGPYRGGDPYERLVPFRRNLVRFRYRNGRGRHTQNFWMPPAARGIQVAANVPVSGAFFRAAKTGPGRARERSESGVNRAWLVTCADFHAPHAGCPAFARQRESHLAAAFHSL